MGKLGSGIDMNGAQNQIVKGLAIPMHDEMEFMRRLGKDDKGSCA